MILYAFIVTLLMLLWLAAVLYIARRERHARDVPAMQGEWPSVTIIVPAMNEEGTIEPAMRSLLELDYPSLEIIAVNDRSTDATGEILDRLSAEDPERLRTVHIDALPSGWLGKCHALHVAAASARGEWILFTDADVLFAPHALRTAAAFSRAFSVDHIVLYPLMLWGNYAEAALLDLFSMALTIGFQTWRVESKSPRAFIGIGAFNMVRASLYREFGGHVPLRLEVADDMKLGYLVKKSGGRSMAVNSDGEIQVRWRQGALDTVRGLERSGFAGVDFSWWRVTGAVAFCLGVMLAPCFLPLLFPSPEVLRLSLLSIITIIMIYGINARGHRLPWWIGILHPLAVALFAFAFIRSAIVTTIRGGLSWRGTFYSIAALKRGTVR